MGKIYCDFSFNNSSILSTAVINLINESFRLSKIENYINDEWVSLSSLSKLENIDFEEVKLFPKEEGRILLQSVNNSLPRICFNDIELSKIQKLIRELELKNSKEIVYGFICENLERGLQNTYRIYDWEINKRPLPSYVQTFPNPIYTNSREEEVISIESLPGHIHHMNYGDMLSFGSCWQMYFSPIYYKYIPKPLFDDFKDCIENVVLENGLRRITLYKDPMDYEMPENRAKQWAFRKKLGIDSIAHELTKERDRIEPKDLPVLITKKHCIKGTTRVTRFLNEENQLVAPSRATIKEIKEYLDDGETVVFESIELKV